MYPCRGHTNASLIMGIYRLKKLLDEICLNSGVYKYSSVQEYVNTQKKINRPLYNRYAQKTSIDYGAPVTTSKNNNQQLYTIAIDTYSYCYKYHKAGRLFDGFLDQIGKFYDQKIKVVYIFDGKSPEDKKKHAKKTKVPLNLDEIKNKIESMTHEQLILFIEDYVNERKKKDDIDDEFIEEVRRFLKKRANPWNHEIFSCDPSGSITNDHKPIISSNEKKELEEMFQRIGAAYYVASGEADDVMSDLCRHNIVDACLSDDMDLLPKGCGNLIQINRDGVTQYVLNDILKTLNLEMHQFVDLCILMGSDYYKTFRPHLKVNDLFALFTKYPSIELFTNHYANTIDIRIANHVEGYCDARKYFTRYGPVHLSKYTNAISRFVFDIDALNEVRINRIRNNETRPRYIRDNNSKYYQVVAQPANSCECSNVEASTDNSKPSSTTYLCRSGV